MPADAAVLTAEFKINLLNPADGERFRFVADVVKPGRTLTICEARAYAVKGQDEKLVATMTGTLMALIGRAGSRTERNPAAAHPIRAAGPIIQTAGSAVPAARDLGQPFPVGARGIQIAASRFRPVKR